MMKTTYQQAIGNEISVLLNQVSPLPDSDGRLFLGLYEDEYGLPKQVTERTYDSYSDAMAAFGALVDKVIN
ncbi:hypothetical protein [Vibrio parahaemolyticus]|uniref:hypothetical protein n=1 Tax=Vibrio parahaemolyticus TaxID=670 RepID=UPI000425C633|nr:hypothetical protein [Vibrio parahaemolyticus]ELZ1479443.1 hypothetical protein [Vibrio parahaemolyticus]HCD1292876.1 hypothetical protein [Vibrio parahaemolyticus]